MDPCKLLNVRRIDDNCISVVAGDREIHLNPDELLRHANRFVEDVKNCINATDAQVSGANPGDSFVEEEE